MTDDLDDPLDDALDWDDDDDPVTAWTIEDVDASSGFGARRLHAPGRDGQDE